MFKEDNVSTVHFTPRRSQRIKKFIRKPAQKSQRSSSRKSFESSGIKQSYIKTPNASRQKFQPSSDDFFKNLASSIMTAETEKRVNSSHPHSHRSKPLKVETLEAEIQLKNHETAHLSSEWQRMKTLYEEEKERRKKVDTQRKQTNQEIRQLRKEVEKLKMEVKKIQKEKQYLIKQVEFLERINYDQKTRNLQSYRQHYLEAELKKLKSQARKAKPDKQKQLEEHIKHIQQEKYTLESHYKALKVANECLLKQLNHSHSNLTQMVLHSDQYIKLREKYLNFLKQYKLLRNEYWSLKTQMNSKPKHDSSIFSITVSEHEDLNVSISN